MANLLYLLGAVVASAIGIGFIVLRGRKPTSTQASIESFERQLKALSPEGKRSDKRGGRG